MPNNSLTSIIPTLYAQGLKALRSNLVMPRLVTSDFGTEVREKGEIIQIPLPSVMTTNAVVPGPYAPDPQAIGPTTAVIPLDSWQESPFTLTEKEFAQVIAGIVPMQLSAAAQALAFAVNASIFNLYKGVGNLVGTPGTTPFASDISAAISAGVVLDNQLAPRSDRKLALSPLAFGKATMLPNFAYAMYAGDTDAVDQGIIKHKLGFDWAEDQQVPTQVAGTLTGTATASGAQAAGSTSIVVATGASSSFAPNVGDVITFAGDTQQYAVQSVVSLGASASGTITILPAKVVALNGGEAISLVASHVVNLAFHPQAFGFASRPVKGDMLGIDPEYSMMVPDPVSGLTMRLIMRQEFHRVRVSFDILWGVGLIRPQLACRIAG